jgi:flagellar motor switch protein FliG
MSAAKKPTPPQSGVQKVATFLLSLDRATAQAVLKSLDPAVVSDVAGAMTELDPSETTRENIEKLYLELARTVHTPSGPRPPDDDELAAMLDAALGKTTAAGVIAKIHERRKIERPFAAVEKEPPALLTVALAEESPAVAALVLVHLSPERSAEILSSFDPDRALDVVRRMATLVPPGTVALSSVAETLKERMSVLSKRPTPADPAVRLQSIASMLNLTQGDTGKIVLEGIEADDVKMATEIREFMFTWADLATVEKKGMQKILSSIETRTLAIALKACPPEVEANIMGNLSSRVREMVKDERELAGPMPMLEVIASRNEIMKSVRSLVESGEFAPAKAGEELVS